MKPRALLALLGLTLLFAGYRLADSWVVSDEERLEALVDRLADAVRRESAADVRGLLTADMDYSGPRVVGQGDRDGAIERLQALWDPTDDVNLMTQRLEITVTGATATVQIKGNVRFRYGDSLGIYKVDLNLLCRRAGEDWLVESIRVIELRPGLL